MAVGGKEVLLPKTLRLRSHLILTLDDQHAALLSHFQFLVMTFTTDSSGTRSRGRAQLSVARFTLQLPATQRTTQLDVTQRGPAHTTQLLSRHSTMAALTKIQRLLQPQFWRFSSIQPQALFAIACECLFCYVDLKPSVF